MKSQQIYTIGHGTKKIEYFLSIIKQLGIDYLVDVRSIPYSKINPDFNPSLV
jgi:uncharacterized protein (DUF488 family)